MYANNFNNLEDTKIDELVDANKDFSIVYNGNTYTYRKMNNGGWICFEMSASRASGTCSWIDNNALKAFLKADNASDNFNAWIDNQKWSAALQIAIGYITKSPTATLWGVVDSMTYSEVSSTFNEHMTVDTEGNIKIDETAVNTLKSYLLEDYKKDNGLITVKSQGNIIKAVSSIKGTFEYEEDYTSFLASVQLYDYVAVHYSTSKAFGSETVVFVGFNKKDFNRLYFSSDSYCYGTATLCTADKDLNGSVVIPSVEFNSGVKRLANSSYYHTTPPQALGYYVGNTLGESIEKGVFEYLHPLYVNDNPAGLHTKQYVPASYFDDKNWYALSTEIYSADNSDLLVFKDYETLYNYVHGEGTYIASKFYDTTGSISITPAELATDISTKLNGIYEAIANGSTSVTNSQELQNLIDSSLDTLNKIEDETEETNTNLEKLIEIVEKQNEILLELLDVTYSIDKSVNNIEAMTAIELLTTIFNDFGQCVDKMKTSFPFSVPFDMILIYDVLRAEPEAPKFEIDFNPVVDDLYGGVHQDNLVIIIDLSQFEALSKLSRTLLSLVFVAGLVTLTRKMFFNGGKIK